MKSGLHSKHCPADANNPHRHRDSAACQGRQIARKRGDKDQPGGAFEFRGVVGSIMDQRAASG
jgi:hypothetical protein